MSAGHDDHGHGSSQEEKAKGLDRLMNDVHFADLAPHVTSLKDTLHGTVNKLYDHFKNERGVVTLDQDSAAAFANAILSTYGHHLISNYLGVKDQADLKAFQTALGVKTPFGKEVFQRALQEHVTGMDMEYVIKKIVDTADSSRGGALDREAFGTIINDVVGKHVDLYKQEILSSHNISAMAQAEVIPYLQTLAKDIGRHTGRAPEVKPHHAGDREAVQEVIKLLGAMPSRYVANVAAHYAGHGHGHGH